jgi:hypothetical protein
MYTKTATAATRYRWWPEYMIVRTTTEGAEIWREMPILGASELLGSFATVAAAQAAFELAHTCDGWGEAQDTIKEMSR